MGAPDNPFLFTKPRTPAMNENNDATPSDKRRFPAPAVNTGTNGAAAFLPIVGAVLARWRWIVFFSLASAVIGLAAAAALIRPVHTVSVQLSRLDSPLANEDYRPQPLDTGMLFGMISSPEALQQTGARMKPPLAAVELGKRIRLTMDRNSTLITLTATGETPEDALALANLAGGQAAGFTRDLQQAEAAAAAFSLTRQLADNEADRARVKLRLAEIEEQRDLPPVTPPPSPAPDTAAVIQKINSPTAARIYDRIQTARDQLDELQTRYTDLHPLVREQKTRLALLETQLRETMTPTDGATANEVTRAIVGIPAEKPVINQSTGYDALVLSLTSLQSRHASLVARQRALQPFLDAPPGYLHLMGAASHQNVVGAHRRTIISVLACAAGILGAMAAMTVVALCELLDDRMKTGSDLARVTGLPLVGELGDIDALTPAGRAHWAFRTWTALRHRLVATPDQGLVCGFTSAGSGEGRSTWINLLAGCARQCGFTVLTISADGSVISNDGDDPETESKSTALTRPSWGSPEFTAMVVANPGHLLERRAEPGRWPSENLPLPGGWIWDLEKRRQWQRALHSWRSIDNIVILVDLPPMADPETALLAEKMPNVVWLAESGRTRAAEALEHLETLRNARCHLAGAVLNRRPGKAGHPLFARWFGRRSAVLAASLGLMGATASAQSIEAAPSPVAESVFSVPDAANRADWQRHLTLGPGDLLHLSVYGRSIDNTAPPVPVGPDGRVSYLEAENVPAAGLTVDEFRVALNRELSKYRNAPDVIVRPAAYRSKRYYVLGAVTRRGAFPLNRPTTLVEAVAQAQGLETRVVDRSLVIQADLPNSFVTRKGRRLPVDMHRLFVEGDLSQNIALEPDDYLYFPPGEQAQVYVLGEVRSPGPLLYGPHAGVLQAVAVRGGFSERAWQKRLLVIRGSLKKPQTFVINVSDILAAKSPDFALQPKDIVYVGSRPWFKAEELLDLAATAFLQSAVVTKTGLDVTPVFSR